MSAAGSRGSPGLATAASGSTFCQVRDKINYFVSLAENLPDWQREFVRGKSSVGKSGWIPLYRNTLKPFYICGNGINMLPSVSPGERGRVGHMFHTDSSNLTFAHFATFVMQKPSIRVALKQVASYSSLLTHFASQSRLFPKKGAKRRVRRRLHRSLRVKKNDSHKSSGIIIAVLYDYESVFNFTLVMCRFLHPLQEPVIVA